MSVRFAPSPTGVFHVGNWRTAWISREWARVLNRPWIVRFEDIDAPRVLPGALERQLREMKSLGLVPDDVRVQSSRRDRHWELFEKARAEGILYPCRCSRRDVLTALASAPHGAEALYSGRCRPGGRATGDADAAPAAETATIAWRFRCVDESGKQDFIVARTDAQGSSSSFVPSYHWACAIDDWEEAHRLLVRAHDLETATPIQRVIQSWLRGSGDRDFPAVFHTALVTADDGARLEKRTKGVTLDELAVSPAQLILFFEKSFEARREDFADGKVWGEPRARLTLGELGLHARSEVR